CESYLRQRGATELTAGPLGSLNPFTLGLYGGSWSPGFLESDALAGPFLQHQGYRVRDTRAVLHCSLDDPLNVSDGRFPSFRQRFEIHAALAKRMSWWRDCVLGPLELHDYQLVERASNRSVARVTLWEMETYNRGWNEHAI